MTPDTFEVTFAELQTTQRTLGLWFDVRRLSRVSFQLRHFCLLNPYASQREPSWKTMDVEVQKLRGTRPSSHPAEQALRQWVWPSAASPSIWLNCSASHQTSISKHLAAAPQRSVCRIFWLFPSESIGLAASQNLWLQLNFCSTSTEN